MFAQALGPPRAFGILKCLYFETPSTYSVLRCCGHPLGKTQKSGRDGGTGTLRTFLKSRVQALVPESLGAEPGIEPTAGTPSLNSSPSDGIVSTEVFAGIDGGFVATSSVKRNALES